MCVSQHDSSSLSVPWSFIVVQKLFINSCINISSSVLYFDSMTNTVLLPQLMWNNPLLNIFPNCTVSYCFSNCLNHTIQLVWESTHAFNKLKYSYLFDVFSKNQLTLSWEPEMELGCQKVFGCSGIITQHTVHWHALNLFNLTSRLQKALKQKD